MYAVIEKNMLHISVAKFYRMDWYGKNWLDSGKEKFNFNYGYLEIDVHKNGKKYLTGFVIDPRAFIIDYLKTRYKKTLNLPRRIESVSIDSGERTELFSVDFLKTPGFVIDGMEKDLIFPMFVKQKGEIKVQGFEVLYPISVIKYLIKRFKYKGTTFVREGEDVYDLKTKRRWKIKNRKRRELTKK
ncbi:MAG: hypothetical protein COY75_08135 [Nitrospirae bacterium CG_4_10_14_0_8_um_filter_41_23]|nr:hypothetical protein [Nitrospirota bacterium]OIP59061.1 MAG: hypothetical protein AUK38_06485 [Nitrospirae bacterium CG2_30_41_42]PIQ93316.1 MAG: hypothetical protein COV68_10685 [Nitrospirae bacterium CG11_big_fil_rev_8_21_14_0_20_41_14]PIV41040.1 MAG: hypothetical protein COS27_10810 [Nitrospirae bacterium CG02_land_8_20_14_3_00_41_53]PIW87445.1 MAG: hypothetical protein COZ94_05230 [Nitrospirae bacterium CG_4_8_14_3_um_filter_41_47]PIY86403.1 MAG: hypothetical protein COY75_08135 [Nitros